MINLQALNVHAFKLLALKLLSFHLLTVICLLSACTPPLDWRTSKLSSHGNTYTITFPGKPVSAQKTVTLKHVAPNIAADSNASSSAAHSLTLHAVQTDKAQFALGHIVAKDAAQAQALALALAKAFADNLAGELKRSPATVAKTLGAFDVSYPASQKRYAVARFFWTDTAAYELLAIGTPDQLTPESADTFIRSIHFE